MFEDRILDSLDKVSDVIRFNPAGCLRMRFKKSTCSICRDRCPNESISLEKGLQVNRETCTDCMLCISVCPADGLVAEERKFFSALKKLREVPSPVLGCAEKVNAGAHARTFCFGSLSEEHIILLSIAVGEPLQINLTECASCRNSFIPGVLKERLKKAGTVESLGLADKILLVEDVSEIRFRDVCCDRRGFFEAMKKNAFKGVASMIDSSVKKGPARKYSEKKLPFKRKLFNIALSKLDVISIKELIAVYYYDLSFADSCDQCGVCAAMCPTGALKTGPLNATEDAGDAGRSLLFNSSLCSGCSLCSDFCLNRSISLIRGISSGDPFSFVIKTQTEEAEVES